MNDITEIFLTLYAIGVPAALVLGVGKYVDGRHQLGARLILAAIVWPIAALLVGVRLAFYWLPRLWREAFES